MESGADDGCKDDAVVTRQPVGGGINVIRWCNRACPAVVAALVIVVGLVRGMSTYSGLRYFVVRTLFPSYRNDTIRFLSPSEDVMSNLPEDSVRLIDPSNESTILSFRMYKAVRHSCVMGAFARAGMVETKKPDWNIIWGTRIDDESYAALSQYQKVNHFPGTWHIGRKDAMLRSLLKLKRLVGSSEISFLPLSYNLPHDLSLLLNEIDSSENAIFIAKPPASSRGRGIYLLNSSEEAQSCDTPCIVQKYISDPYLINSRKFDLRVYAVVTSFNPLRIYVFKEGLVRFATEEYTTDLSSLGNQFVHLTNYGVNKKSKKFRKNMGDESCTSSSKWTLSTLRRYLEEQNGVRWEVIWDQVRHIIASTILSCEDAVCSKVAQVVKHRSNCFELYGFDILLDSRLKAYLLEVNIMPALGCGSPLDKTLKSNLVAAILQLVGVEAYNRKDYRKEESTRKKNKILGLGTRSNSTGSKKHSGKTPSTKSAQSQQTINFQNLSSDSIELDILREVEDECHRMGDFEKIYPTPLACKRYEQYFQTKKYYNTLLSEWEYLKAGFTSSERAQSMQWLRGNDAFPSKVTPDPVFRKPTFHRPRPVATRVIRELPAATPTYMLCLADEMSSSHFSQVLPASRASLVPSQGRPRPIHTSRVVRGVPTASLPK